MTSIAFCAGVLPLIFGSGAGSEMRQAMGIAVFSGMLGVTLFGIFLTPVFYVLLRTRRARRPGAQSPATPRLCRAARGRREETLMSKAIRRRGALSCSPVVAGCAVGPDYRAPAVADRRGLRQCRCRHQSMRAIPRADLATFWRGFDDPVLTQLVERAHRGQLRRAHRAGTPAGGTRGSHGRTRRACFRRSTSPAAPAARCSPPTCCPARRAANAPATYSTATSSPTGSSTSSATTVARPSRPRRRSTRRHAGVHAAAHSRDRGGRAQLPRSARPAAALRGRAQSLENQRQTLRLVDARLDAGRGTQLDVSRASSLYDSTEATLPALQAAIDRDAYRLATLTAAVAARRARAICATPRALPALPVTDLATLPLGTPEQLLRRRPDLVQSPSASWRRRLPTSASPPPTCFRASASPA